MFITSDTNFTVFVDGGDTVNRYSQEYSYYLHMLTCSVHTPKVRSPVTQNRHVDTDPLTSQVNTVFLPRTGL